MLLISFNHSRIGDGEDNNEDDYHDDDNGDSDDSDGAADDDNRNRRRLCLSEECVVAAGKMISIMKKSVDPCEDFYEHVCGNFEKKHEPFEDVTRTMSFEMLRRENQFLLHNKLKKMPENSGKSFRNLSFCLPFKFKHCIPIEGPESRDDYTFSVPTSCLPYAICHMPYALYLAFKI